MTARRIALSSILLYRDNDYYDKSHFINFHSWYLGEMFVEGEDLEVMLKADGSNENI